jgi:hypothetical protein
LATRGRYAVDVCSDVDSSFHMIPSRSSQLSYIDTLMQKYDEAHAYGSVMSTSLPTIRRLLGRRCMHALASPGFSVLSIVVGNCRSNKGVSGCHTFLELPHDHLHITHTTQCYSSEHRTAKKNCLHW